MPRDLLISREKPLVLRPVRPNVGLRVKYQSKMDALIAEMQRSLVYWLSAAWRSNPPEMAMDASPAMTMRRAMQRLTRFWMKRFDEAAPELADYFATDVEDRSAAVLKKTLRKGGFSVRFQRTRAMNDVLQATIGENVGLIKSIAQKHLSEVEGLVMRSVIQGRKLDELTKQLEHRYGLTRKRAALISRDQNNKATSQMQRARQLDLGITQGQNAAPDAREGRQGQSDLFRRRRMVRSARGPQDLSR